MTLSRTGSERNQSGSESQMDTGSFFLRKNLKIFFRGRSAAAEDRRCAGLGRDGRGAAGRGGDRPQRRRSGQRRALKSSSFESPPAVTVGDCGAQTKERKNWWLNEVEKVELCLPPFRALVMCSSVAGTTALDSLPKSAAV